MKLAQAVNQYDYNQLESPVPIDLTAEQLTELADHLQGYHALYSLYFHHPAQEENAYNYLLGLLKPDIKRKSAENIALGTVGETGVRSMQTFVGQSPWTDTEILAEHTRQTEQLLGDANGVLLLDGSDFPKQGADSVGVKRQWCGELGKKANCQAGVFLGYSSGNGYTLLNRRLYLPEEWFSDEYAAKRYKTGVPSDLTFQTKNELAWAMIEATHKLDTLSIRWVTMDEAFGKDTQLLDRIETKTDYAYFAEVPVNTRLWTTRPLTYVPESTGRGRPAFKPRLVPNAPDAVTVQQLAATFDEHEWQLHALKDGSKGLIFAYLACRRIIAVREGLPGPDVWLIVRRNPANPTELKYFLSNAPLDTSFDDFALVCAWRWPIETIFEEAKQYLGLNEYETRSWRGWHHHMTLVILAFGFLARSHVFLKDDAPALTLPQVIDLLAAVLPKRSFTPQDAIDLIRYKQKRIASAKRSHYSLQKTRILLPLLAAQ
jgi:SRSO17 transposase